MDKSKKSDPAEATRAATEQIEKSRLEREQRIEATQEKVEPLRDELLSTEDESEDDSRVETRPPVREERAARSRPPQRDTLRNERTERSERSAPRNARSVY